MIADGGLQSRLGRSADSSRPSPRSSARFRTGGALLRTLPARCLLAPGCDRACPLCRGPRPSPPSGYRWHREAVVPPRGNLRKPSPVGTPGRGFARLNRITSPRPSPAPAFTISPSPSTRSWSSAGVVSRIFRRYAETRSFSMVSSELNEKRIPAQAGGFWYPLTIRRLLSTECYIGRTFLGRF